MGFSNRDRLALIKIMAASEESLGAKRIEDVFEPSFFTTNFWYMWVTTFAFQPWHSAAELRRYMHRFIQEFSRIDTLAGVRRTAYNQYDCIVLPLIAWLKTQGVHFVLGAQVTDVDFAYGPSGRTINRIHYFLDDTPYNITVTADDVVFVTNGSMTAASTFGSMTAPAPLLKTGVDRGCCGRNWLTSTPTSGGHRHSMATRPIQVDVLCRHDAHSALLRPDGATHREM